ncbi:MAG: tRNA-specific adenosine deaminase, partial [Clostridia bacterium]|nr:tRNA-specific adenosine deaminase [Clostridia bacterium]
CAGAIINSRLKKVTYGASDLKAGSCHSVINLFDLPYNHKPKIESGYRADEASALLSDFFKNLRDKKRATDS